MILSMGYSPNEVDSNGWTLLHLAAALGNEHVIKTLIQYGVNPEIQDNVRGFTCLHYAAMHGFTRLARILLEVTKDKFHFIDTPNIDGWTPLHVAAHYGRDKIVKTLLYFKATVDPLSLEGTTPLQLAVMKQKVNCVRKLIGAKARINVQGGFPLRHAIIKGYLKIAELLLKEGADPTLVREEDNQTPLHLAVLRDEVELCKILYRFGALCWVHNDNGETPLTIATVKIRVNEEVSSRSCLPILEAFAGHPRSLKSLCRFVIRENVYCLSELHQLPLPTLMVSYLKYKFD
ncbi:ankyrin repeat and SOCS box protein 7-like isoform X2 [Anneissia japonica]|nr:ankyrin repeat and SOCS box protein 7-like isoform X2 [Anneissia japonica]XP_033125465.1 ankyrin repeat and SOCS box protein 7-like isoform X2 [Anneissia japonica]XP_033125466.1 ankyrin repeat and SOCS box protein 7-like isoform X2 [Anneissia japonica]